MSRQKTDIIKDPYIPVSVELLSRHEETTDTTTLVYRAPQGFSFSPGQFNMLFVPGIGEAPVSISGSDENSEEVIHTVRNVGAVSAAISKAKPGSAVGLRGPFGRGWPTADAVGKDVIIVAGGIGLAPLRPALYHILSHRGEYGRVHLLYGARSPRDLLYRTQLRDWVDDKNINVEISVDKGGSDWLGHVGVITRFIPWAQVDPSRTVAFVCGPEVMIRFSVRELQSIGIVDKSIFISMERNMRCGLGHCGHCQFGADFVCKEGPVFSMNDVAERFLVKEV